MLLHFALELLFSIILATDSTRHPLIEVLQSRTTPCPPAPGGGGEEGQRKGSFDQ